MNKNLEIDISQIGILCESTKSQEKTAYSNGQEIHVYDGVTLLGYAKFMRNRGFWCGYVIVPKQSLTNKEYKNENMPQEITFHGMGNNWTTYFFGWDHGDI